MKKRNKVQVTKLTRVSLNLNGEFVTNDPANLSKKLDKWLRKHGVASAKIVVSHSDKLYTNARVPGVQWQLHPTVRQNYINELKKENEVVNMLSALIHEGVKHHVNNQNGAAVEQVKETVHQDHD